MAADRRQQRPTQLPQGKAGRQQPGIALRGMRRQLPRTLHHQLHAGQERPATQHHAQRQPDTPAHQAGQYTQPLQPQGGGEPGRGTAATPQAHQQHPQRRRQAERRPEQVGQPLPVELLVGHLRQEGGRQDVTHAIQRIHQPQAADADTARRALACSRRHRRRLQRPWQPRPDRQQHHQRGHGIDQPQCCRAQPPQMRNQRQQTRQRNAQAGPREHQGTQALAVVGIGHLLAEAGDHHQHPGAGHAGAEAQQQVAPEPVCGP
ncbi:hypothetical protein D3C79_718850 [compost metagenome]